MSILLDTGSAHNFIDPRAVQRTGLVITSEPPFNVIIAGRDKLHSGGLCRSVPIKCQGTNIVTDFHILPIGGCQMVLGVDWLQTLDELTLNFKNQSVKFSTGGRVWELKGVQAGAVELVQADIMDKTLFQTAKGGFSMSAIKKILVLLQCKGSCILTCRLCAKNMLRCFGKLKAYHPKDPMIIRYP